MIRIDGKTATCPNCGSVAVSTVGDVPGTTLRCDRCGFRDRRQRFPLLHFDEMRGPGRRPTVIGGRVLPILLNR